jgi:hypothetical protein
MFVISGEDDLWRLLAEIAGAPKRRPHPDLFKVVGWEPHLLYFPDEPLGQSISPTVARAVAGFHSSLSRSYAYTIYGRADGRCLHLEDLAVLDMQMLVISGGSGIDIPAEALDRLTKVLVHKLMDRQTTILLAIFLLLHFGETVTRDWIAAEYAQNGHAANGLERIHLSAQETNRMKLLASVLEQYPGFKPMADIADEGRVSLLRSVIPYERAQVLGTEITRDQAATIVAKEKERGQGRLLDGRFEVVEIDVGKPEGFMGTLRYVKTQKDIRVAINRRKLSAADVKSLFAALDDKSAVHALISAWVVGGKINYAEVLRADPVKAYSTTSRRQ